MPQRKPLDIRKIVRQELELRQMTPYDLSKVADVPKGTLYRWLKYDDVLLRIDNVEKVLDALGLC